MRQQIRFTGLMDLDSKDDVIASGWHKHALNMRFLGNPGNMTGQNIAGNILVENDSLPATGTNKCNGSFYDPVRKRILWFNYNSGGLDGIYSYSLNDKQITPIFICGTQSSTNILNLDLNFPVHSASIVYRTTEDGDLFYWTDELNRPRYINLDTVVANAPFTEDMINAAKNAPLLPPEVDYLNDNNVTVNNLRKQLFQFCYRLKYKNLEYSTTSPYSKLALPANFTDPDTQNDPTKNNNIEIVFRTGGSDFQAVEILGRVNLGTTYGDWFSVVTLDRDDYGFNPDTNYFFQFYNDSTYTNIDPKETDLYFSYLPDKANTLELLNGNVIIYGGLTDGYPPLTRGETDVTVTAGISSANSPAFTFVVSGANEFIAYIGPTVTNGTVYQLRFDYVSGHGGDVSPVNTIITAGPSSTQNSISGQFATTVNAIPNLLSTALSSGYFRVSIAAPVVGSSITNIVTTVSTSGAENPGATWDWSCNERLGLIYFDDRSKTNGVISWLGDSVDTTDFAVTTPDFLVSSNITQVPYLTGSISHLPPSWATSYQWVRAVLTPKLLYWITNDYQQDSDYLYLCIQNLIYTREQYEASGVTGYVPSYEFAQGDRVRVLASFNSGTGFYTPYNLQLDMEIVGTVTRTMLSPASNGLFIKVQKPTTFPSGAYLANMLIKLYTPYLRTSSDRQLFFEWGERYGIYASAGIRYHRGQITDQTAVQAATFQWFDGDCYFKNRQFYLNINDTSTTSAFMIDQNYSDYFVSQVNSNGRGWAIEPNANTIYRQTQSRWGQSYQQDTNINQLNIFYANDFDTYDLSKGAVRRFKSRDRILRVFQENGVGEVGVYNRFIKDSGGTTLLETSDTIITTNNIQYYIGECGLGDQPCALMSARNVDYFIYPITGNQFRLSSDGITNLSELYKGQFYLKNLIVKYNNEYTQPDGSKSKIMGAYDYFDEQAVWLLQEGDLIPSFFSLTYNQSINSLTWGLSISLNPNAGDVVNISCSNGTVTEHFAYTIPQQVPGTASIRNAIVALINNQSDVFSAISNSHAPPPNRTVGLNITIASGTLTVNASISHTTQAIDSYAFAFNETRNGFCSFYSFKQAEWIAAAEDILISWKDGQIYTHDSETYCNFFGEQFSCSITIAFNGDLIDKKTWLSITQVATNVWVCPSVYTNSNSYQRQRQDSVLIAQDFQEYEGQFNASFLRDSNSIGGLVNGDFLKGSVLVAQFEVSDASDLQVLSELMILTRVSQLTSV